MTHDTDYTEADRWDWDTNDDRQYCEHGTFIGSWWGPDILCQWCEAGISAPEAEAIMERNARESAIRHALHFAEMVNFAMSGWKGGQMTRGAAIIAAWLDTDIDARIAWDTLTRYGMTGATTSDPTPDHIRANRDEYYRQGCHM